MERVKLIEIYADEYKKEVNENNWDEEFLTDNEIASMYPPTKAELDLEFVDNNADNDKTIKMMELEDIILGLDDGIKDLKACIANETGYYQKYEQQEELKELAWEKEERMRELRELQDEYEGRSRKIR